MVFLRDELYIESNLLRFGTTAICRASAPFVSTGHIRPFVSITSQMDLASRTLEAIIDKEVRLATSAFDFDRLVEEGGGYSG